MGNGGEAGEAFVGYEPTVESGGGVEAVKVPLPGLEEVERK